MCRPPSRTHSAAGEWTFSPRRRTARRSLTIPISSLAALPWGTALGRVLFTQDIRFKARAQDWQREARPFAGLLFGHQLHGSIGQYVRDLELIAKATEPEEWISRVEKLPLG
jgi:hypothetical protein